MDKRFDGVKGIVKKRDLVLILVKDNGTLDLPGGRVESGETVKSALGREINEETGLKVEICRPVQEWSFYNRRDHLIRGITFECGYLNGKVKLSVEHERYFWAAFSDIGRLNFGHQIFRNPT